MTNKQLIKWAVAQSKNYEHINIVEHTAKDIKRKRPRFNVMMNGKLAATVFQDEDQDEYFAVLKNLNVSADQHKEIHAFKASLNDKLSG